MRRLQYQMLFIGDKCFLRPCICAPEQKYDGAFTVVELLYNVVGVYFPAPALMRVCLTSAHRQDGVEQEHSAVSPRIKLR